MNKKRRVQMNILYIPAVTIIAVFMIFPLLRGFYISFFKWNGYSSNMIFVGIENYLKLFKDKYFCVALGNTLLYGFGTALLQNVFGLVLALYVNSKFKGRNVVRTCVYITVMVSGLLMGYIMKFFFDLNHGIINEILQIFGADPVYWLGEGKYARIIITFVTSWQYVGSYMIIYLAGLQNIPSMYYEAAKIDGGNSWQVFKNVVFPLLIPSISTAGIQGLISGLKLNDVIIALTKGGPVMSTHSLSTYISFSYFDSESAGYASAIGIFLFTFIFVLSGILNKYFQSKEVSY